MSSIRCLLLRPLHHHYLCQCRSSGDWKPDTSFPVCLQAKLHSSGLPVSAAVHRRAPSLHRKPLLGGIGAQVLPLKRCGPQLLLSHLHSGRKLCGGRWTLKARWLEFGSKVESLELRMKVKVT